MGLVAQLVERCLRKAEAAGSNPAQSTYQRDQSWYENDNENLFYIL